MTGRGKARRSGNEIMQSDRVERGRNLIRLDHDMIEQRVQEATPRRGAANLVPRENSFRLWGGPFIAVCARGH